MSPTRTQAGFLTEMATADPFAMFADSLIAGASQTPAMRFLSDNANWFEQQRAERQGESDGED